MRLNGYLFFKIFLIFRDYERIIENIGENVNIDKELNFIGVLMIIVI